MTPNEEQLIRVLEDDIRMWEQQIAYFDREGRDMQIEGGPAVRGREYAAGLRNRIKEWRELIAKVREV